MSDGVKVYTLMLRENMLDDELRVSRIKNYVNFTSANQELEIWVNEFIKEVEYQKFGETPCVNILYFEEDEEVSGVNIDALLMKSVKIGYDVQIDIYVI